MPSPYNIPQELNVIVGTAPTLISRPSLLSGGIVSTVRGSVGQTTSFVQEGAPLRAVQNLVLRGDIGTARFKVGDWMPKAFATTDVNVADNEITETGHNFQTGDGPYQLTTTTTLPAGISLVTDHFIIRVDDDTYRLATTRALAHAGTEVDITDQGTGTHTITGLHNVAEPATVSVVDGSGSVKISAGQEIILLAPKFVTVVGGAATTNLGFFWTY